MNTAPRVTGIRIRPEHRGLRASLFDLEADIMEIVWSGEWRDFSVGDVHHELAQTRSIAYTTVLTTVSRLFDKGLLTRRKDGRRYLYAPQLSRDAFIQTTTRNVLESLPDVGRREAMALLLERVSEGDDADLDELEALIQQRRRTRDTGILSRGDIQGDEAAPLHPSVGLKSA